jgi:MFS family permease
VSEATEPTDERTHFGYSEQILILIGAGTLVTHLGWFVLPPLLPSIVAELEISRTLGGVALSLLTLFAAVSRYPGGKLADELSEKTVITFSLGITMVGILTLANAPNYPFFVLGVVLLGTGLGTYVPSSVVQISELFRVKQGRALGVNNAAANLSGICASGLASVVLLVGPWQLAFVPIIGMLLVLLVLWHVWNRSTYRMRSFEIRVGEVVKRLFLSQQIRLVIVIVALLAFVWNGALSFLPTFLETERGFSVELASLAFGALFVLGIFTTPLTGAAGDRFGHLRTLVVLICCCLFGLLAIVTATNVPGTILGVLVFAVGLTGYLPVATAYLMESLDDAKKGRDYGMIGAINMGVGSAGPAYVGLVGDTVHFTAAYAGLGVCLLVCLAVVTWLFLTQ